MQERIDAVAARMREEWNRRAQEDAHFYVAFGRRDQGDEEFFDTAREVVLGLRQEMKRLPRGNKRARRALEIGCGPARLLRPLSEDFGEIHGLDVSDGMIAKARANLAAIPHAHAHHTSGAGIDLFADESFDFIYSYAVFQHIPSADVVFRYLDDAVRVLKPGGVIRVQLNGLPRSAAAYDTWSGVRIPAGEVLGFARDRGLRIYALEGVETQYMWTTLVKPAPQTDEAHRAPGIRRVTNAHSSEPMAPPYGRFASISVWVEDLPPAADLLSLEARIAGRTGRVCYIGPPETGGLWQVNVLLPALESTGLAPVELLRNGAPLCAPAYLRIVPPGPGVPRVISVADGVNLLSGLRIESRIVKVTLEESRDVESFRAVVDGSEVERYDAFCTDPAPPRYEINFALPAGVAPGARRLDMTLGRRRLGAVVLDVA